MFSRRLAPLFRDHWPDEGHGTVHFPVIGAGRSVAPGRQEWGVLGKTWNRAVVLPGRGSGFSPQCVSGLVSPASRPVYVCCVGRVTTLRNPNRLRDK